MKAASHWVSEEIYLVIKARYITLYYSTINSYLLDKSFYNSALLLLLFDSKIWTYRVKNNSSLKSWIQKVK